VSVDFRHARDIADQDFLDAIDATIARRSQADGMQHHWATRWDLAQVLGGTPENIGTAQGTEEVPGVPHKVVLAKAARLIKRGLISGCACGCRGDFERNDR
jgi:hypothetical protein